MENAGRRVVVCDTSVLLAGGDPRTSPDDQVFVPPSVIDEVRNGFERERLDTLQETGLNVRPPEQGAREKVEQAAKETGDRARLSSTDLDLLALAYELRAELLTDDRAMQNVARSMQIAYKGFAQEAIKDLWHWVSVWRCVGCGRTFEVEVTRHECPICGHEVKRKHWRVPKGENFGGLRKGR